MRRARDRLTEVVPYLQAGNRPRQDEQFDDTVRYVRNARRFPGAGVRVRQRADDPVDRIALELIWSAHESSVWADE